MKKNYNKPTVMVIEAYVAEMLATSLTVGSSDSGDKVTNENQVLTRHEWGNTLWSYDEDKE